MCYEIRQAELRDIAVCAQIEANSFSEPWSERSLTEAIQNENALFYVLSMNDNIVGYYVAENICDEINLYTIAVTDSSKGKGYGKALLSHLINKAKTMKAVFIGLEVRVSNLIAISLYEKNGFLKSGTRKAFYKKPVEDAHLYTLLLNYEDQQ